jgi:hypothetical protein
MQRYEERKSMTTTDRNEHERISFGYLNRIWTQTEISQKIYKLEICKYYRLCQGYLPCISKGLSYMDIQFG